MNRQELTILIPTYNRPHYLIPLLQFLKAGLDLNRVRIEVLDGSDEEHGAIREICAGTGWGYKYYGSGIPLMERWTDGIKNVRTEFASILADDDILQPEGVYPCLDFLKAHSGYSIAHGKYIWFTQAGDHSLIYPGYQNLSFEHDSPPERLFAFLSAYVPVTYGVYRSSALQTAYEESILAADENDLCFIELLTGCLPVILGKVKKLEVNYYGRRIGTPTPRLPIIYPKIMFEQNFSHKYSRVKAALKKHMQRQGINPAMADDTIDFSFGAWFGKILSQEVLNRYFASLVGNNAQLQL